MVAALLQRLWTRESPTVVDESGRTYSGQLTADQVRYLLQLAAERRRLWAEHQEPVAQRREAC